MLHGKMEPVKESDISRFLWKLRLEIHVCRVRTKLEAKIENSVHR